MIIRIISRGKLVDVNGCLSETYKRFINVLKNRVLNCLSNETKFISTSGSSVTRDITETFFARVFSQHFLRRNLQRDKSANTLM